MRTRDAIVLDIEDLDICVLLFETDGKTKAIVDDYVWPAQLRRLADLLDELYDVEKTDPDADM